MTPVKQKSINVFVMLTFNAPVFLMASFTGMQDPEEFFLLKGHHFSTAVQLHLSAEEDLGMRSKVSLPLCSCAQSQTKAKSSLFFLFILFFSVFLFCSFMDICSVRRTSHSCEAQTPFLGLTAVSSSYILRGQLALGDAGSFLSLITSWIFHNLFQKTVGPATCPDHAHCFQKVSKRAP